jgi:hypothetical protein
VTLVTDLGQNNCDGIEPVSKWSSLVKIGRYYSRHQYLF